MNRAYDQGPSGGETSLCLPLALSLRSQAREGLRRERPRQAGLRGGPACLSSLCVLMSVGKEMVSYPEKVGEYYTSNELNECSRPEALEPLPASRRPPPSSLPPPPPPPALILCFLRFPAWTGIAGFQNVPLASVSWDSRAFHLVIWHFPQLISTLLRCRK